MSKLKIAFFGTPELTTSILDELFSCGYTPEVIITQPDRPQGRKMIITPPPAKAWALAHNIPVLQPEKIDENFISEIKNLNLDISLVVAYGKIMPTELIDAPKFGSINLHYSLLPKYRGATPVESAILAGDATTGVSIQQMKYELDAGAIIAQSETEIGASETAPELRIRLNDVGKKMIVEVLKQFETGNIVKTEQDENKATHCAKIKKEDGLVNLEVELPSELWNKYRAYFGWPSIYFFDQNGKRVKITKATFQDDKFVIEKIIPEGKKETDYSSISK